MQNIDALKEEMLRPKLKSALLPLLRFRGPQRIEWAMSRWNFVQAMRLHECENMSEGTKLFRDSPDLIHLCGFHTKEWPRMSMYSFFSRLAHSPKVIAISPDLTDYVNMMVPGGGWDLVQINSVSATRRINIKTMRSINRDLGRSQDIRTLWGVPQSDTALMRAVHEAVPAHLHPNIRNDLCQDLVLEILEGSLRVENVRDAVGSRLREARKFTPHTLSDLVRVDFGEDKNSKLLGAEKWKEWYTPPPVPMEDRIELLQDHFDSDIAASSRIEATTIDGCGGCGQSEDSGTHGRMAHRHTRKKQRKGMGRGGVVRGRAAREHGRWDHSPNESRALKRAIGSEIDVENCLPESEPGEHV